MDWSTTSGHTVDKLTSCDRSPEPGTVLQDLSWLTKPSLLEDVFAPSLSTDDPLSEDQHSDSSDSVEYSDPPDDEAMLDFLRHLSAFIRKEFKADPPDAPFRPGPVKWGGQVNYIFQTPALWIIFWLSFGVFSQASCMWKPCLSQTSTARSQLVFARPWSTSKKARMLLRNCVRRNSLD